jgi:protein-S-isoprenylcysteine O-methyltransferase Ste14
MLLRSMVSLVGTLLFLAVLMFLPAGVRWLNGWILLLVFTVCAVLSMGYLWRVNPEIFVARSKVHKGTKAWDKPLMVAILVSLIAIFPTAGIEARYAQSNAPPWLMVLGYAMFTLGFALSTWVCAVNKFAEPSVRIQSDRGQTVVDTGPYAIVRHPMYAASLLLIFGISFALGSYWALLPVAVIILLLIVRTIWEDDLLHDELAGYKEYSSRVRYRLIPGLW